jgi:hypothetical protein
MATCKNDATTQTLRTECMPPKRRFWKEQQKMKSGFSKHLSNREYSIWATDHGKVGRKSGFHLLFILPRSWFGEHKVGNNISETYPRIGQGLNDAPCVLRSMLSSLMRLPNPAWVSLGNVVSHLDDASHGRPGRRRTLVFNMTIS